MTTPSRRTFRAPGRVNLMGDHTDHTGGLVLPAAIDRSLTLDVVPAADGIALRSDRHGDIEVAPDGSSPPGSGWGRYVAAVAAELATRGREPVGMTGSLTSDLPDGSGLSSSAALCVVVTLALAALADLPLEPAALVSVARVAEVRAVGVPVGIMDQSASVLGRPDHAVLLDCGTGWHRLVPLPPTLSLLVIDSGVRRQLEHSGYTERRTELDAGLVALSGRRPADVDPDELPDLLRALPDLLRRRVRHVVTENRRVVETEQTLTAPRGPDPAVLQDLFAASHASLRDDFEVSVPVVDRLVEIALERGAVAARMTGGGFGGAVVALVPAASADEVAAEIAGAAPLAGGDPTVLACRAAGGAGEVSRPG